MKKIVQNQIKPSDSKRAKANPASKTILTKSNRFNIF